MQTNQSVENNFTPPGRKTRALILEALHRARIEIRQVESPALAALLEVTGDILDQLRMAFVELGAAETCEPPAATRANAVARPASNEQRERYATSPGRRARTALGGL